MQKSVLKHLVVIFTLLFLLSGKSLFAEERKVSASYLYTLSNFTGIYPISWAKLDVDRTTDEVYVVALTKIKVFNETGMEIYTFNETGELG